MTDETQRAELLAALLKLQTVIESVAAEMSLGDDVIAERDALREEVAELRAESEAYLLTFQELQRKNEARCEAVFHPVDSWSPSDWAMAATGELGEMCNKLKKRRRGERVLLEDIGDEMADTVIYLDLLATRLGFNLGGAIRRKFNLVSERRGSEIRL